MNRINVTSPFIAPKGEILARINNVLERKILTNQGPEVQEFERNIREYLHIDNFQFVANGTVALQLALKALSITEGEIITTPFTYVATISSILWERCEPVFADIEPDNFTIDANKIEELITERTKAIMPVHVFGYKCDVKKIESIAKKYRLKVIYDAAHAFGTRYEGESLLKWGDVSTLSFHATKLFHTIEGGGCIVNDVAVRERLDLIKRFGHNQDSHICLGINAKQDEINAAFGNVNLRYIEKIISERKRISEIYNEAFRSDVRIQLPKEQKDIDYNYAYYPMVFKSEEVLLRVFKSLNSQNIYPRRYFYPSLNLLPYVRSKGCSVSENVSRRVACLPLYVGLNIDDQKRIIDIVKREI